MVKPGDYIRHGGNAALYVNCISHYAQPGVDDQWELWFGLQTSDVNAQYCVKQENM